MFSGFLAFCKFHKMVHYRVLVVLCQALFLFVVLGVRRLGQIVIPRPVSPEEEVRVALNCGEFSEQNEYVDVQCYVADPRYREQVDDVRNRLIAIGKVSDENQLTDARVLGYSVRMVYVNGAVMVNGEYEACGHVMTKLFLCRYMVGGRSEHRLVPGCLNYYDYDLEQLKSRERLTVTEPNEICRIVAVAREM